MRKQDKGSHPGDWKVYFIFWKYFTYMPEICTWVLPLKWHQTFYYHKNNTQWILEFFSRPGRLKLLCYYAFHPGGFSQTNLYFFGLTKISCDPVRTVSVSPLKYHTKSHTNQVGWKCWPEISSAHSMVGIPSHIFVVHSSGSFVALVFDLMYHTRSWKWDLPFLFL